MSNFLREIRQEIQVRLDAAVREREELRKAADRIKALDTAIKEISSELAAISARIPEEVAPEAASARTPADATPEVKSNG